jgi:hypothetical protein
MWNEDAPFMRGFSPPLTTSGWTRIRTKLSCTSFHPYAPEHNPDEYLNNDLKQQLKNLPRPDSQEDLVEATSSVLRSLQRKPHRIRAYFHHKDVRYAA